MKVIQEFTIQFDDPQNRIGGHIMIPEGSKLLHQFADTDEAGNHSLFAVIDPEEDEMVRVDVVVAYTDTTDISDICDTYTYLLSGKAHGVVHHIFVRPRVEEYFIPYDPDALPN